MSLQGNVRRESVRRGVSAGDLSSGKGQSGKCLLGKLSYNQIIEYLGFGDFRLKILVTNADSLG